MMDNSYFRRVNCLSPTRFWINNPTQDEARKAIEHGALGCTTNPSFGNKMLEDPAEAAGALRLLVAAVHETSNDDEAAAAIMNPASSCEPERSRRYLVPLCSWGTM